MTLSGLLAGATVLATALAASVAHAAMRRAHARRAIEGSAASERVRRDRWSAVAPLVLARIGRRRDAERFEAAVPAGLEALARSLRSGVTLGQALEEVAADGPPLLRDDLRMVLRAAQRGSGLVPALEDWTTRRSSPSVRLAVAALCLGVETGGAQARAVDGVAATLRQRRAAAAEARALATQARASAAVIALAPVAFCGLASSTDPRIGAFLFRSPAGLLMLALGLGLDAVGAWWMARLTRLPV